MGTPRDEVIEYLGADGERLTDEQLNVKLQDLADIDYTGPDHVQKEEV